MKKPYNRVLRGIDWTVSRLIPGGRDVLVHIGHYGELVAIAGRHSSAQK